MFQTNAAGRAAITGLALLAAAGAAHAQGIDAADYKFFNDHLGWFAG
ncbi:MAG: hypothetical protein ABIR94_03130 [Rubrivivax sp.]